MKKLTIILITALFTVTSAVGFAAEGQGGGGAAPADPGARFDTPRGFGEEASQDDTESHERMFNESAPGAWSQDPEPGKDKPSSEAGAEGK